MATPTLLQKARQRKMIYFGVIVALFTVSLVHREFVLKTQATALQLREASRGEVELTSSAVRLMLTGSRGLAVTFLWYNAIEKQRRAEWNELELLVKSITKLQPYFITPWLFQSWNLSFNVAVESDRPRDKYFYISRGLELLAEGERRNRGTDDTAAANDPTRVVFPGNPEMRHFMGFFYQLKIGNSDERRTMRSLLELSCIDPLHRDPNRFWRTDRKGRNVNMTELAQFTRRYPRLIRRLNEQLGYTDPPRIVKFLEDYQDIPNRFKPVAKAKQIQIERSELKEPNEQFPILPPPEKDWPDPRTLDMTDESIDVFLICRAWYEFSIKPLPPPDPRTKGYEQKYDKLRYRMPKQMMVQLFREYPPRAQVYIAEALESEGWFDSDGWDATEWFDKRARGGEFIFGTDAKYHSRRAWQRGYEMFKEYGLENGIYIPPGEQAELVRLYQKLEQQGKKGNPPLSDDEFKKAKDAEARLTFSAYLKQLTNLDSFLYQAEGESDPITVAARKKLFMAERKRKRESPTRLMLELFEEGWDLYVQACFRHPKFAQVKALQEETYELYQNYLGEEQNEFYGPLFKKTAVETARAIFWVTPNVPDCAGLAAREVMIGHFEKDQAELAKVRFRLRLGKLDRIQYYDGPMAKELKEQFLFRWIQGASLACNMNVATAVTYPGHEYYLLTRQTRFFQKEEDAPEWWQPIISDKARQMVFQRLGLNR